MPLSLVVTQDSNGLESARPAATAVPAGYVYFATDINTYTVSDATNWINITGLNAQQQLTQSKIELPRSPRVLYWENASKGNLADTNYISNTAYALAANTLSNNGDRLNIEGFWLFSADAATKTWHCNIGYSAWTANATGFTGGENVISNATTTTTILAYSRCVVERLTPTTGAWQVVSNVGASGQATAYTPFNATWSNALNILCDWKSSAATANVATLLTFRILFSPYTA